MPNFSICTAYSLTSNCTCRQIFSTPPTPDCSIFLLDTSDSSWPPTSTHSRRDRSPTLRIYSSPIPPLATRFPSLRRRKTSPRARDLRMFAPHGCTVHALACAAALPVLTPYSCCWPRSWPLRFFSSPSKFWKIVIIFKTFNFSFFR